MEMAPEASWEDIAFNRSPERRFIRFRKGIKPDKESSLREGRPVFRDADFIEIATPGDRTNIIEREISDSDRREFARQYDAWKKGQEDEALSGTPLSQWPQVTRADVENFAYFKVRTVEHLAGLSEDGIQKIPGCRMLVQKAKDFLEAATKSAPLQQMREELSKRDNTIEVQSRQIKEQAEGLRQMREALQRAGINLEG